ncbi:hypothetical protein [Confluentibacter citreus]|uniref:hypothetical protein n=1 Tax=Confluentibacter citreus TaxID=2007307 RepID=UPI0018737727|nr:hypothetical protein [Confluentibacter citreus]
MKHIISNNTNHKYKYKHNKVKILNSYKRQYFTKQIVLVFILFISFFSGYAQNGMERKQLFDYDWKFFLGDASEAKTNDFNYSDWRKLDLPHDLSIEGKIHTDLYVGNIRKAWKGRALVVIKSNRNSGEIKLLVTSNGLEEKSIIIKSTQSN